MKYITFSCLTILCLTLGLAIGCGTSKEENKNPQTNTDTNSVPTQDASTVQSAQDIKGKTLALPEITPPTIPTNESQSVPVETVEATPDVSTPEATPQTETETIEPAQPDVTLPSAPAENVEAAPDVSTPEVTPQTETEAIEPAQTTIELPPPPSVVTEAIPEEPISRAGTEIELSLSESDMETPPVMATEVKPDTVESQIETSVAQETVPENNISEVPEIQPEVPNKDLEPTSPMLSSAMPEQVSPEDNSVLPLDDMNLAETPNSVATAGPQINPNTESPKVDSDITSNVESEVVQSNVNTIPSDQEGNKTQLMLSTGALQEDSNDSGHVLTPPANRIVANTQSKDIPTTNTPLVTSTQAVNSEDSSQQASPNDVTTELIIAQDPVEQSVGVEKTTPDTATVAENSTSPDTATVAENSTSPDTATVAENSTPPDTATVAENSTPPDTATVAENSTPPDTATVAENSTPPDTATVAENSTPPDTATVAENSTPPDTATVAENSTPPSTTVPNGIVKASIDPIKENGPIFVGWDNPLVTLVITGQQNGYLEPCGCAGLDRMKGGLSRRHTFMKELRDKGWPVIAIDVGGMCNSFGKQAELKFHTTVSALRAMKYDAIAVGKAELGFPAADILSEMVNSDGTPGMFVSANVSVFERSANMPPTYKIIEAGGLKFGITSVLCRSGQTTNQNTEILLSPTKESLKKVLPILQSQSDIRILLSHGTVEEATFIAKDFPDIQIIVTAGGNPEPPPKPVILPSGQYIITVGEKGMCSIVLGFFEKGVIKYQRVPHDSRFTASPEVRQMMQSYQDQLKQLWLEGLGVRPIPPADPARGANVGPKKCETCHEYQYDIWKKSKHAHAFHSLETATPPRDYDPECVCCHVVGWHRHLYFPYQKGYIVPGKDDYLKNVSCEACHGSGEAHIAAESSSDTANQTAQRAKLHLDLKYAKEKMCGDCHDLDNSPDFDPDKYWEQIQHKDPDDE